MNDISKKIFFVGDFTGETGPGVANRILRSGFKGRNDMLFSESKSTLLRVLEIAVKLALSENVCFCSFSKINKIGIVIARLLKKNTFYIMHGYVKYENRINCIENNNYALEEYIFKNIKKIFCVSQKFMDFMKKAEPEYKAKFDFNYNAIDHRIISEIVQMNHIEKHKNRIVSVGGGMRRKNNLAICKAIDILNRGKSLNLEYIVIGEPHNDKEEICWYPFVTYYDHLPRQKVLEIFASSYLYIQNSSFETFGLAVIEAFIGGCNLLVSDNVGALSMFTTCNDNDVIFDTNDVSEIAAKLYNILLNSNAERLRGGFDLKRLDPEVCASSLLTKIIDYQSTNK